MKGRRRRLPSWALVATCVAALEWELPSSTSTLHLPQAALFIPDAGADLFLIRVDLVDSAVDGLGGNYTELATADRDAVPGHELMARLVPVG